MSLGTPKLAVRRSYNSFAPLSPPPRPLLSCLPPPPLTVFVPVSQHYRFERPKLHLPPLWYGLRLGIARAQPTDTLTYLATYLLAYIYRSGAYYTKFDQSQNLENAWKKRNKYEKRRRLTLEPEQTKNSDTYPLPIFPAKYERSGEKKHGRFRRTLTLGGAWSEPRPSSVATWNALSHERGSCRPTRMR